MSIFSDAFRISMPTNLPLEVVSRLTPSKVCSAQVDVTWVDTVGVTVNGISITKYEKY